MWTDPVSSASTSDGTAYVKGFASSSASVSISPINVPNVPAAQGTVQRHSDYFFQAFKRENLPVPAVYPFTTTAIWGSRQAVEETGELFPPSHEGFAYDADGNLLTSDTWTNEYDAENRLRKSTSRQARYGPNGNQYVRFTYTYDYMGRRVQKVTAYSNSQFGTYATAETRRFLYQGWMLLAELVEEGGSQEIVRSFTWGIDLSGKVGGAGDVGGLLGMRDHTDGKIYLSLYDGNGNTTGLVNGANGAVDAIYEYDPFGRPIREQGSYAAKNPFRFSSQYTDHETGLVYFGFRYYHPQWGRFINRDPIEEAGGENLYRFVSNDPVNRWDWMGLAVQINYLPLTEARLVSVRSSERITDSAGRYVGQLEGLAGGTTITFTARPTYGNFDGPNGRAYGLISLEITPHVTIAVSEDHANIDNPSDMLNEIMEDEMEHAQDFKDAYEGSAFRDGIQTMADNTQLEASKLDPPSKKQLDRIMDNIAVEQNSDKTIQSHLQKKQEGMVLQTNTLRHGPENPHRISDRVPRDPVPDGQRPQPRTIALP